MIKKYRVSSAEVHDSKPTENKPLSDEENASNKEKSKVRVRVEHVFGFMKTTMKVDKLRAIGKERIEGLIGLLNLSYNICRYVHLRQSLG